MAQKLELSESPVELKELAITQAGSVVSRALVSKPTGTITLFAFGEGEGLSEHTAPYDALVQVLEGEADILIGDKEHIVPAGSIILLPANVPHAVNARVSFKMLLTMIRA